MHNSINQSTKITFLTCLGHSRTVLIGVALHSETKQATHPATLADDAPTDPIIESVQNRAVANHFGGNTRQLMKTRHCWQHFQAHSEPSQAHFCFYPSCFLPHGAQLLSLALSPHLISFSSWFSASLLSYSLFLSLVFLIFSSLEPV